MVCDPDLRVLDPNSIKGNFKFDLTFYNDYTREEAFEDAVANTPKATGAITRKRASEAVLTGNASKLQQT